MCNGSYGTGSRNGIVQNQLPTFLSNKASKNPATGKPTLDIPVDETVYGIWIGTNDIGNAGWATESQIPRSLPLTAYTDCVYAQLDRLYAAGARSFVLQNQGPLDLIPMYALPENGGVVAPRYWKDKVLYNGNLTQVSEKMREYIVMVNEVYELRTQVDVLLRRKYPGSHFALFDTNALVSLFSVYHVGVILGLLLMSLLIYADDGHVAQPDAVLQRHSPRQRHVIHHGLWRDLQLKRREGQLHVVRRAAPVGAD